MNPLHTDPLIPAEQKGNPRKRFWVILIIVVPIFAGITYFAQRLLVQRSQTERPGKVFKVNPAATTQALHIPFSDISLPDLSTDGRWICFAAANGDGTWDVYTAGISGQNQHKVTTQTSTQIPETDFSPDGNMILYDRWNPESREFEVCTVPSSGGPGTRIAEPGTSPRWRPDGRRIGYLVRSRPPGNGQGTLEFRSMRPDGSDPRIDLEEPDYPTAAPPAFAWSPDGKSAAIVRSFAEGYQELFIHGFESGAETQLTFDQRNIGSVCWSKDSAIVYSSNKGGGVHLWIVPADGGTPVQVSNGDGPDVAMNISDDGSRLLMLRRMQEGRITIADSDGIVKGQSALGGQDIRMASLSPEGGRIAYEKFDPDPLQPVSHLCVAGSDGSDPRPLTSGNELVSEPRWSPDGKWISYCGRLISEPADSERAYLLAAGSSGEPKSLGPARDTWWLDSSNLVLNGEGGSWRVSTAGGPREVFYKDSTMAIPIAGGELVLFRDLHKSVEERGWWIDSIPRPQPSNIPVDSARGASNSPVQPGDTSRTRAPRFILPASAEFAVCPADRYILYREASGQIRKKSLADSTERILPGKFPERAISFSVSPDGKEIIFVESNRRSQLLLMENLR